MAVVGRGRPGDLVVDQARVEQDVVDDAELVVEHPATHARHDTMVGMAHWHEDGGADGGHAP